MSDHVVHVFHSCRGHDPRLRKEGSVCWMGPAGEQSCFERRHDLLAGDGGGRSAALFQQRFVAAPGRFGVAFADMVANRLDACREGVYMATAFLGIGVQEAIIGLTRQNCCKLPCQVGYVADALAHSLADERRLLVCGIAGKEYAALTPFCRNQSMKAVAAGAP